jgi:MraZ protein
MDSASRVLVAPELREDAGLVRDVVMVGMGRRLELLDKLQLDANRAKTRASALPPSLEGLVL